MKEKGNAHESHRIRICARRQGNHQNINILDISQTLMQGYFTMIMLVDLAECEMPFDMLSQHLRSVGEARGLAVHVQRQDIFDAMHRI